MAFRILVLVFRVYGGLVRGLGFRILALGFREWAKDLGGLGFRVKGMLALRCWAGFL